MSDYKDEIERRIENFKATRKVFEDDNNEKTAKIYTAKIELLEDILETVANEADKSTDQALHKHIVSFSEERAEVCDNDYPEKKVPKNMGYGKGGEMVYI